MVDSTHTLVVTSSDDEVFDSQLFENRIQVGLIEAAESMLVDDNDRRFAASIKPDLDAILKTIGSQIPHRHWMYHKRMRGVDHQRRHVQRLMCVCCSRTVRARWSDPICQGAITKHPSTLSNSDSAGFSVGRVYEAIEAQPIAAAQEQR